MAAGTSSCSYSYSYSCPWTREWKRRKVDENNSSAIQQHHHHHLPEGVIEEILVRLPAKSILRFKSVCKTWYLLIRSRYFLGFHRSHRLELHHQNNNRLFFSWLGKHSFHVFSMDPSRSSSLSDSPIPTFEVGALLKAMRGLDRDRVLKGLAAVRMPFDWEHIKEVFEPNMKVLGPLSNGIYAVSTENFVSLKKPALILGYCNVALCNPATGEFNVLPTPPVMRLTCTKSFHGFGSIVHNAGGVESVLDYKTVVIAQELNLDGSYQAFVYSQRRGPGCGWKCIKHFDIWKDYRLAMHPVITQNLHCLPQALVNGCCHWAVRCTLVLRFDFTKEVFGMIPGPPYPYYDDEDPRVRRRSVFAINDRLAQITIRVNLRHATHYVDVWVMKEYGIRESWTRICSSVIRFEGTLDRFLGMFLSRDGELVERLFFQLKRGIVLSYDCSAATLSEHVTPDSSPSRWTTKEHDGYDGSWACWKTIGLSRYVETLERVDLGGNNECTI